MTGIWPFQASNAPTTLSHAEGAYLYLQNDKKILDAAGALWWQILVMDDVRLQMQFTRQQ